MEHEELTRMNRLLDTTGAPRENAKGVTLSFEARLQWVVDNSGLTKRTPDVCQSCGNRTFKPAIINSKIEVCVACGTRR